MQSIMQNTYDEKRQDHFERVDDEFKPQLGKYNLKPPKPTKANELRTKTQLDRRDGKINKASIRHLTS